MSQGNSCFSTSLLQSHPSLQPLVSSVPAGTGQEKVSDGDSWATNTPAGGTKRAEGAAV